MNDSASANEERTCKVCGKSKRLDEFSFRNKTKGVRHSYCLECGCEKIRRHYRENVRYYVKKARTRRRKLAEEVNANLFDYLAAHPCVDCGESDPAVLEFDHVRGEKSYNVSEMTRDMLSWSAVLEEITKCDVRCANCNRRKTAARLNSYRYQRIRARSSVE